VDWQAECGQLNLAHVTKKHKNIYIQKKTKNKTNANVHYKNGLSPASADEWSGDFTYTYQEPVPRNCLTGTTEGLIAYIPRNNGTNLENITVAECVELNLFETV